MESEQAPGVLATDSDASRTRLVLKGERGFGVTASSRLELGFEVGVRHDGGDAERGTGLEAGGRAGWTDAGTGVSVEVDARTLLAHEGSDYSEWGVSGAVRLDPGASGRGFSFALTPAWGATTKRVERLWSAHSAHDLAPNESNDPASRLDVEVAYGLDALGGLLRPYGGLGIGGDADTLRAGARFMLGERLTMGLEGEVSENGEEKPAAGLRLEGVLRW